MITDYSPTTATEAANAMRQVADQLEAGELDIVMFAASIRIEGVNRDLMGVYYLPNEDDNPKGNRILGLMMRLKRNAIQVFS